MNTNTIIQLDHVSKHFGTKTVLSDIHFTMENAGIYALLGRNGSGKTTLMNLLTCRYFPTDGTIKIFHQEPFDNENVLPKICFMSDHLVGFQDISIRKILNFAKTFYPTWSDTFMQQCLTTFHLDPKAIYQKLSKGMQSAVSITIALSARTPLTLLDEIHTGLDASVRQDFYKLLLDDYLQYPRTYLISTHLIDEMEPLFSHVLLLNDQKLFLNMELEAIKERSFECVGTKEMLSFLSDKNILATEQFLSSTKAIIFDTLSQEEKRTLKRLGVNIRSLSLQEIFIALTKETSNPVNPMEAHPN